MRRPPPRSTRTDTLLPYTTLCRSPPCQGLSSIASTRYHRRSGNRPPRCRRWQSRYSRPPRPGKTLDTNTARMRNVELKRSEEHTSELQSLMRISYAVFCLKKKTKYTTHETHINLSI